MPGSTTAPSRPGARNSAPVRVAFHHQNGVGTRKDMDFAAQWLPYAIPCRRFAGILANTCARFGADVVCYAFHSSGLAQPTPCRAPGALWRSSRRRTVGL